MNYLEFLVNALIKLEKAGSSQWVGKGLICPYQSFMKVEIVDLAVISKGHLLTNPSSESSPVVLTLMAVDFSLDI